METFFFRKLADLNITGNLQLTIAKGGDDRYIVSILLQNDKCGDDAKRLIPPLNLKGTAAELDNGFFEHVIKPLQTASDLMVDMDAFFRQVEEARKKSAMEKEKTDRERKEQDAKTKKYTEAMAKVDELDSEGKHREAWMKLPTVEDHPEKAEEIRKRRTELSGKFAPDLFGVEKEQDV